jgi:FkbM family methyltransferase
MLQGVGWYLKLGGIRAVCCVAAYRLFGRPRLLKTKAHRSKFPIYLRIDTSDFCAFYDILISKSKQYGLEDPPFSPQTIVDAGAHIGIASILFARRYPLSRIVAVEPEPSNFALLLKNIAPYKNIQPICAAIWKETGEVTLGSSSVHPKGAFQITENGGTRVRALTIDALMREADLQSIDLLKIDIEGSEKEVFDSCNWISRVQVIAIELHDRIKLGCRHAVEAATRDFRSKAHGEITFFVRQHESSTMNEVPLTRAAGG